MTYKIQYHPASVKEEVTVLNVNASETHEELCGRCAEALAFILSLYE